MILTIDPNFQQDIQVFSGVMTIRNHLAHMGIACGWGVSPTSEVNSMEGFTSGAFLATSQGGNEKASKGQGSGFCEAKSTGMLQI